MKTWKTVEIIYKDNRGDKRKHRQDINKYMNPMTVAKKHKYNDETIIEVIVDGETIFNKQSTIEIDLCDLICR